VTTAARPPRSKSATARAARRAVVVTCRLRSRLAAARSRLSDQAGSVGVGVGVRGSRRARVSACAGLGRRGRARVSGGVGVRGSREAWACAGLGRRERARGLRNDAVGEVRLLSPRVPPHADTAHARRLTPTRARKRKRTAKNSAVLSTLAKQEGHCLSETLSRETRSEPERGQWMTKMSG